jgi:aspartyl-tRNA(Asn)/glutamyl-tRNA(Gln) amidotransferase subunit C
MSVTSEDVKRVARLARLKIGEDRVEPMRDELNAILAWIEQLQEVDVEGVAPMTSAVERGLPMREDVVTDGNRVDDILKNAPKSESGFFIVPKVVE